MFRRRGGGSSSESDEGDLGFGGEKVALSGAGASVVLFLETRGGGRELRLRRIDSPVLPTDLDTFKLATTPNLAPSTQSTV